MDWNARVELFEQLRREHEFGVGTIAGVAAKFGVHRRLVRQAIAGALPPPHLYPRRVKPKLDAVAAGRKLLVAEQMEKQTMGFDLQDFAMALLEGTPDAVVYSDATGKIRVWNKGAERVFGFTAAEALGRSLDIIVPTGLRARHWQGYENTMRTGQTRYGAGELLAVPAIARTDRAFRSSSPSFRSETNEE